MPAYSLNDPFNRKFDLKDIFEWEAAVYLRLIEKQWTSLQFIFYLMTRRHPDHIMALFSRLSRSEFWSHK